MYLKGTSAPLSIKKKPEKFLQTLYSLPCKTLKATYGSVLSKEESVTMTAATELSVPSL